jgi:tetratricopeptide (TPR) repeat protein
LVDLEKKDNKFSVAEKSLLTGLLVGYFFQNLFVFDNITSYILFMMILAFAYSQNSSEEKDKPVLPKVLVKSEISQQGLVAVAVIGFIFVLYFVNIKVIISNTTLLKAVTNQGTKVGNIQADLDSFKKSIEMDTLGRPEALEHLTIFAQRVSAAPNVSEEIRQNAYSLASTKLKEYLDEIGNNDARYSLFLGALHSRFGGFGEAITELTHASELSPKKQAILFELSNVYARSGDIEKAYEVAKKAFDYDPSYIDARNNLIAIALASERYEEAETLFKESSEDNRLNNDRLISAFASAKRFPLVYDTLNEAITKDPENSQNYLSLAATYLLAEDKTNSIATLKKYIEVDPAKNKKSGDCFIDAVENNKNPQTCLTPQNPIQATTTATATPVR